MQDQWDSNGFSNGCYVWKNKTTLSKQGANVRFKKIHINSLERRKRIILKRWNWKEFINFAM